MSNRWGRQIEPKTSVRKAGPNNINININFNAVKEKNNAFVGKKIDNFLEINNSPKNVGGRPNVSMETLKQKKRNILSTKDTTKTDAQMQRKSKSRLGGLLQTPEKRYPELNTDSKSVNKKSTKKRKSKSYENIRHYLNHKSPRSNANSHDRSNSKSRSKSRSKSKSQSGKKLMKATSTNKIQTINKTQRTTKIQTKPLFKSDEKKDKNQKNKKNPSKKIAEPDDKPYMMRRKKSEDNFGKKRMTKEEQKKIESNMSTKPKSRKASQSTKSLKPLPLIIGEDQNSFDEQKAYKNIQKQSKDALYQQKWKSSRKTQEIRSSGKPKKKQTIVTRYMAQAHTYQDIKRLTEIALTIQRYWRGYSERTKFMNKLTLLNHDVEINKKKITNLDPKFWDGASDSIVHAEDPQSQFESEQIASIDENNKPISISDTSSIGKKKMSMNRVIDCNIENQMLERMNKLENQLKMQREKAKKLEQENLDLKNNLQKAQNFSGNPSIQSSLKQSGLDSWEEVKIVKNEHNNQEQHSDSQQFQLRLPKRILDKKQKKNEKQPPKEKNQFDKYKQQMEIFECSSPKNISLSFNIDTSLRQLFDRKQIQLKETYQKKSTMYERMYNDKLFSPRTYTFKKNQLQQIFKKEAQLVKNRLQQAKRVTNFIKQIESESLDHNDKKEDDSKKKAKQQISIDSYEITGKNIEELSSIKKKQQQFKDVKAMPQKYVVEDYEHMNLNSYRSKQQDENEEGSLQNNSQVFENNKIKEEIQSQNKNAIRIFQKVSEELDQEQEQKQKEQIIIQKQLNPSQEPNQQNAEAEQVKPKGLETTLMFIKEYCVSFVEFIRASDHKNTFIDGLCSPIQYDNIQFLKVYHTTTSNDYNGSFNSQEAQFIYPFFKIIFPRSQVIVKQAFLDFNESYDRLKIECDLQAERDYFLNSLLDAFNQSLDFQRPGSIYGKPLAWLSEHRHLKNNYIKAESYQQKQQIFLSHKFDEACGVAIARVIQWATCLCGFIPQSPEIGDVQIGEQQINQIHQSRMALMLQKDLIQSEENILDTFIQQTQVKLHLSEIIFKELVEQLAKQANFFK